MGSTIEINDTLKISKARGFPAPLTLDQHLENPLASAALLGQEFAFWNPDERLYHRAPTRVWLVEEIDGNWLYWGHAHVVEQTIKAGRTEGRFRIVQIYLPDYQRQITDEESPPGKSYFSGMPSSLR